jgi:hypothetical protein
MLDDIYEQQAQLEYQTEPKAKPKPQRTPPIMPREAQTTLTKEDKVGSLVIYTLVTLIETLIFKELFDYKKYLKTKREAREGEVAAEAAAEAARQIREKEELDIAKREYTDRKRRERQQQEEFARKASKVHVPLGRIGLLPPAALSLAPFEIITLMQLKELWALVTGRLPSLVVAFERRLCRMLEYLNPQTAAVAQQIITPMPQTIHYVEVPIEPEYTQANILLRDDGTTDDDPNLYFHEAMGFNTDFNPEIALPNEDDMEITDDAVITRDLLRATYYRSRLGDLERQVYQLHQRLAQDARNEFKAPLFYQRELLDEDIQYLDGEIVTLRHTLAELEDELTSRGIEQRDILPVENPEPIPEPVPEVFQESPLLEIPAGEPEPVPERVITRDPPIGVRCPARAAAARGAGGEAARAARGAGGEAARAARAAREAALARIAERNRIMAERAALTRRDLARLGFFTLVRMVLDHFIFPILNMIDEPYE